MKGIKVVNKAERGEIYIYGTIVDDFTGDLLKNYNIENGYTFPKQIRDALDEMKDKPVDVFIDSNGGLVSAGMCIAAFLKRHEKPTVAHIDTWAASIASVIALACDTVEMPAGTYLMIHRPIVEVTGNTDMLNEAIAFLNKMGEGMLDIYESKANEGVARESIWDAMVKETWLSPSEASAMFANVKQTEAKFAVAAEACSYENAPDELKQRMQQQVQMKETVMENAKKALELAKEITL